MLGKVKFIGLQNYFDLFDDPLMGKSIYNTIYYSILLVPSQTLLGFALAWLLYKKFRGVTFFRTIFYLPVVLSYVVIATIFKIVLNADIGLINSFLHLFGIASQPFLTSTSQALPSIVAMSTWKWVGTSMIIFIGGLNDIPESYYEAAALDGGSQSQQLIYITLPMLKRVTSFVLVINTTNAFKLFTPVYIMTNGGPNYSTLVSVYYSFITAFRYQNFGYASAIAILLLAIVMVLTIIQLKLMKSDY